MSRTVRGVVVVVVVAAVALLLLLLSSVLVSIGNLVSLVVGDDGLSVVDCCEMGLML